MKNFNLVNRFICAIIFIMCLQYNIKAQDTIMPSLSHKEMLRDYDYLTKILLQVNPQLKVKEIITGANYNLQLNLLQKEIDSVDNIDEFVLLVKRALNILQDAHLSIISSEDCEMRFYRRIPEQAYFATKHHIKLIDSLRLTVKFNPVFAYINGQYYNIKSFNHKNIIINKGYKVIKCNGQNIHDYVNKNIQNSFYTNKWDYEHGRYFSTCFYNNIESVSQRKIELTFEDSIGKMYNISFDLSKKVIDDNLKKQFKRNNAQYFDDDGVLYIRLCEMNDIDSCIKEIHNIGYNNKIDKIVIDIRNNPGGSDLVWQKVLSNITDTTLIGHLRLGLRETGLKYLKQYFKIYRVKKNTEKISFLNNIEYVFPFRGLEKIRPDSQSINYKGKIILLQENIFSSAGAMSAFANNNKRFVTIGNRSGWVLGRGMMPFYFMLPNSKIIFKMEGYIDFTNARDPKDLYQDNVGVLVKYTLKDFIERYNYEGDVYSKDFLFNYDPMFKKALEIK